MGVAYGGGAEGFGSVGGRISGAFAAGAGGAFGGGGAFCAGGALEELLALLAACLLSCTV